MSLEALHGAVLLLGIVTLALVGTGAYAFVLRRHLGRSARPALRRPLALALLTALPSAAVAALCFFDFRHSLLAAVAPAEAYTIQVLAHGASCSFGYPDGVVAKNLMVVPQRRPIRLVMSSADVAHRIVISAFRVASDALPGRYATAWFEAAETGEFPMRCPDGVDGAVVRSVDPVDFDDWLDRGGNETLPASEYGRRLFTKFGCATCHAMDGPPSSGPSLRGLLGRTEKLVGGGRVVADSTYLRESITLPAAKVVEGYPPIMPAFSPAITSRQIDALVSFLSANHTDTLGSHDGTED